jgi:Ca2+-binding EF-hand superfamily protein
MTTNVNINDKAKFIRAVEEAFFILDRDRNRSIGPDDFCALAKSIGIDLDSNEALLLLRTALGEQTDDPIHETFLTVDQYATLMLRHVGSSELNDELRRTFDALDRDHDGKITRHDMDRLRYENDFFNKLDDEQYELMIKELLLLGNNGVNFDQFVHLMMQQ